MKVFIIAEVGQAHDGSLGILHSMVDAVSETGVDAVKFQTHIAEAESSIYEPFRVPFSFEDSTRYEYWWRMEFTPEQWAGIKTHCEKCGLEFISSPFSCKAVDLLEKLGVKQYKIGSGEVANLLLLEKINRTGKPVLLSSGMSTYHELARAVRCFDPEDRVSVLQCTSRYPTGPEDIGLNVIGELKERFGCRIGLSDHSGTIFPSLAAVALGAGIIEVHVTFDKKMFGPDSSSSLTPAEMKELVRGIRFLETSLSEKIEKDRKSAMAKMRRIFGKSLAVNNDLPKRHVIRFEDLEAKKPAGHGVAPAEYKTVVGKKLLKAKAAFDFLSKSDFQ